MGSHDDDDSTREFTRAEWQAIQVHKYYLSLEAGYDVGERHAVEHWLLHHAGRWRHERLRWESEMQMNDILKHKWLESEKAGRDLGEQAAIDWVKRYAAAWRQWWEEQQDN